MTTTIADTTDTAIPDDDLEFAQYVAEELPEVLPNSPLWHLYHRGYNSNSYTTREKVLEEFFGDRTPPSWRDPDEDTLSTCLHTSTWASYPARVVLSRHYSQIEEKLIRMPFAQTRLAQRVLGGEPYVRLTLHEISEKGTFNEIQGSRYCLRLAEAAELAHVLLLMVDVARGSSDEIGGAA